MLVKEIKAKTILSKSQVYDYALNPYVGCQHNCTYCYAKFMKRFTGHREQWGEFVDVKINAPELLIREIRKRVKGTVWISGVCDPYQYLEEKYTLTRRCLEILVEAGWPLAVQTKSPLVLRDIEILKKSPNSEVGFTITTADDGVRRIFEADAPPIEKRVEALGILHAQGIRTYAMVAPLLPGADGLVQMLKGKVNHVLIDRYNYHYADGAYKKHGMEWAMAEDFLQEKGEELRAAFEKAGVICEKLY
ncbi:MAG: Radical SAM superfamily protein [Syntrophorhabdus sp. PtaU1.Bin153]|nr:MAG: Radical SAM superfamily protein [Syntrophorhabdus sp. PtaU1.Bin153]